MYQAAQNFDKLPPSKLFLAIDSLTKHTSTAHEQTKLYVHQIQSLICNVGIPLECGNETCTVVGISSLNEYCATDKWSTEWQKNLVSFHTRYQTPFYRNEPPRAAWIRLNPSAQAYIVSTQIFASGVRVKPYMKME